MRMLLAFSLLVSLLSPVIGGEPKPTSADVEYGKHERNKLDFWKAESKKPTPLVIFFHGGGFKQGDKADIKWFVSVNKCLAKGVSVATVNYRFLEHVGNDYQKIMGDSEDSVKFILKNARKWNIDKKRVAVVGCSAGALITEWIGTKTKYASALGIFMQPYGADFLVLRGIKRSCPPIIMYHSSGPDDKVHHPTQAKKLKDICDKKRVECELWGSKKSGFTQLPNNEKPDVAMLKFFHKKWKLDWDKK